MYRITPALSIVALLVALLALTGQASAPAAQADPCILYADPIPSNVTYPAYYDHCKRTARLSGHVMVEDAGDPADLLISRGGHFAGDPETMQPLPSGAPLGRLYWRGYGGDAAPLWNAAHEERPWVVDWYNAGQPNSTWGPGGRDGSSGEILVRSAEQFTVERRGAHMEFWVSQAGRPGEAARMALRLRTDGVLEITEEGCNPDLRACMRGQLKMDNGGGFLARVIAANGAEGQWRDLARAP